MAILFNVKVVPGASKTELMGLYSGALRIRLASVPEKGKANALLINFLSDLLGCSKKDIEITSGLTNPHKILSIKDEYKDKLAALFLKAEAL